MVSPVLQERVKKAAAAMKVEEQYVWAGLDALGIGKEDEDALSVLEAETTREGDARRVFVDHVIVVDATATPGNGVSVKPARFLMGWAILKGKDGKQLLCEDKPQQVVVAHAKSIPELGDRELIQRFHDEPDSTPVINELMKRSEDRAFVIYDENNKVDVEQTLSMLRHARRVETKSKVVIDRGHKGAVQVRLFRANETPLTRMEVCPVHSDMILVDGCCDTCQNSWKQVPMEVRQVVRVAISSSAVKAETPGEINTLIKDVKENGVKNLLTIPMVQAEVSELQRDDAMPKLIQRVSKEGISMKVERRY